MAGGFQTVTVPTRRKITLPASTVGQTCPLGILPIRLQIKPPTENEGEGMAISAMPLFPVAGYRFGFDLALAAGSRAAGSAVSDPCCSSDPRNTLSSCTSSSSQISCPPSA